MFRCCCSLFLDTIVSHLFNFASDECHINHMTFVTPLPSNTTPPAYMPLLILTTTTFWSTMVAGLSVNVVGVVAGRSSRKGVYLADIQIGSVVVVFLLLGMVQFLKGLFNLEGRAVQVLTYVLGFVLLGTAFGLREGLLPDAAQPYIEWVVFALTAPLSAMGYYEFVRPKLPENDSGA